MKLRELLGAIGIAVAAGVFTPPASAGVVVVTNLAGDKVSFVVVQPDGRQVPQELAHSDVISLPTSSSVAVDFHDGAELRRYSLRPNGIYYFRNGAQRIVLLHHPIPGLVELPEPPPGAKPPAESTDVLYTIPVKLLADEKEPRVRRIWEKEYRGRLAAASAIYERACRIRFEVIAVEQWTSGDNAHDFQQLVDEFQRTVKPAPGRLAIGFTGQYQGLQEDKRMGGALGPFRSHVLIREWGRQITESERLEMLVHELGHYLGAAHSAEPQSVMRPDFSDRQSRVRGYRIRFDALNALAIGLLDEEYRKRPFVHLGQLSPAAKGQLRPVYQALAAGLPNDPAAPRYLAMLDQSLGLVGAAAEHRQAVVLGARRVVQAVSEAARKNDALPDEGRQPAGGQARRTGDKLTEHYVREAAAAAKQLPRDMAGEAFLLALGVALDDAPLLPNFPFLGDLWRQIESPQQRLARLAVFASPTMRGRHDLAQHFAVSAALAVVVGPQGAEGAGILKELSDSQGGSGFSFIDLQADMAGVAFAGAVGDGRLPLARVESGFLVEDFLPPLDGLREGIPWTEFIATYGNASDARWLRQRDAIRARVLAMPGYRSGISPH